MHPICMVINYTHYIVIKYLNIYDAAFYCIIKQLYIKQFAPHFLSVCEDNLINLGLEVALCFLLIQYIIEHLSLLNH